MQNNLKQICDSIPILPTEYVATVNGLGRTLAKPICPRVCLPESDVAMVDGYAVAHADIKTCPVYLEVLGESNSVKPYNGALGERKAVKIFAGGKIPSGADTVVSLSKITTENNIVTVNITSVCGENICMAGMDFAQDKECFDAGSIMNARLLGLVSTMQILWLPVVRKPRIAILAVGNELAMPGEVNAKNQISASSLYTVPANIVASGGEPIILGISGDSPGDVEEKMMQAIGCDLLITTGGTSQGAGNLIKNVLDKMCQNIEKLTVQIRRNDCMFFSRYQNLPICSLPGNPTSASIYFSLFVEPIIIKMSGKKPRLKSHAILGRGLDAYDMSVAYLHATLKVDSSGVCFAYPLSAQDGILLTELSKSDCLVCVNENKNLKKGDFVEIIPLSHSVVST